MRIFSFILLLSLICSTVVYGDLESTTVLPQSIFDPVILYGVMSGLGDRFNSNGYIEGVTDRYHVQLIGPTLSKLDPGLKRLIDTLNASSNQRLGDQLSVGTLDFSSHPSVSYIAPQLDYGLTKNISVGIGIPIIHYHNDMSIVASGKNNAAAIHATVGSLSPEADAAFDTLAALDIPSTLQQVLATRGYKPIRSVDMTGVGDLILSAQYKYYTGPKWSLAVRPFIQVPTGSKADPNDLESFATGGQPAIGAYSIHDYTLTSNLVLTSSVGYQANIQDTALMRVPTGPDDFLPSQDRLDTVTRRTGNSTFLEAGLKYNVSRPINVGAYYDITFKDPDWFTGTQTGWDYSVLSNDTGSLSHMIKAQLTFSTIDWYTTKLFAVPFQVIFVYGDTLYAENAPNVILTQLYLRMFF